MELILRAVRESFEYDPDGIRLYAIQKSERGRQSYRAQAKMLEWQESKVGDAIQPFLRIEKSQAQKFMDDLWDCGLRPSEGSGSAGAMKKTEEHLQDMRMIAFHKLGIKEKSNGT